MKDLRREYKLEKKEHKNTFTFTEVIFISLTFGLVVFALTAFIVYNVSKKTSFDSNLTDIVNSYEKIVDSYYEDVDKSKLAESAIDGMFDYLNEDYSKLLDNNSANTLTDSLTDSYKGIGIVGIIWATIRCRCPVADSHLVAAGSKRKLDVGTVAATKAISSI